MMESLGGISARRRLPEWHPAPFRAAGMGEGAAAILLSPEKFELRDQGRDAGTTIR